MIGPGRTYQYVPLLCTSEVLKSTMVDIDSCKLLFDLGGDDMQWQGVIYIKICIYVNERGGYWNAALT